MSVLDKYKFELKKRGIFGAVTGERLSGKSTLAGTLPGKTAMLVTELFETGAGSAIQMAKKMGNMLDVYKFDNISSLLEIAEAASKSYDNIYIDSASGITEVMYRTPEMQALIKKNSWDGFRFLAEKVEDLMLRTKELTENSKLNILYTVALVKDKDGDLVPETKGNAVVKNIRAIFPVVLALRPSYNEDGKSTAPTLVTSSSYPYMARLDDLLIENNPGVMDADLSKVLKLLKG